MTPPPLDTSPIRITSRFQGPSGSGQGGWTSARFAERIAVPVTVALRAPTPLDTDLFVRADGADRWRLATANDTTIMIAEPTTADFPTTDVVDVDTAGAARAGGIAAVDGHPAPDCFSCGRGPDTMRVHAGPLGDGRFATDWTVPEWAARPDGSVDHGVVWAAIDCTAAWWVGFSSEPRMALTAQFTAEVLTPLRPGETYALVAWPGDHEPGWVGRKRHAASAAFDRDGRCVARSTSLWVSPAA